MQCGNTQPYRAFFDILNMLLRADSHAEEWKTKIMSRVTEILQKDKLSGSRSSAERYVEG